VRSNSIRRPRAGKSGIPWRPKAQLSGESA
jgi:hypothetical protein